MAPFVRYLDSIVLGTTVADIQRTTYKVILHIYHKKGIGRPHNLQQVTRVEEECNN